MSLTEYHATRKARLARLMTPPGGRDSSELEIVTDPSVLRAKAAERVESERQQRAEDARRAIAEKWANIIPLFPHNPQSKTDQDVITVRQPKFKEIVETVAEFYGVEIVDIVSERRTYKVVRPRQVISYLARTMTTRSFPQIGQALAGRDHTTILHGYTKIKVLIETDRELADEIEYLRDNLLKG